MLCSNARMCKQVSSGAESMGSERQSFLMQEGEVWHGGRRGPAISAIIHSIALMSNDLSESRSDWLHCNNNVVELMLWREKWSSLQIRSALDEKECWPFLTLLPHIATLLTCKLIDIKALIEFSP